MVLTALKDRLSGVLSIICFVTLWEGLSAAGVLDRQLLPPPHAFLREALDQEQFTFLQVGHEATDSKFALANAACASMARVLAGISIGFALGLLCGGAMTYFKGLQSALLPLLTLVAPISPVAWIPFALIAFGIGNKAAVFVVVIAVFFLISIGTVTTVQNVPVVYVKTARTLGATRWQIFYTVLLPSALPSLFVILRLNLFAAWMSVIAAEMVGVSQGLGAMVMVGRALFNVKLMFLAMTLIGISGFLIDAALLTIQRRVLWWPAQVPY
jgi:NitT/TauT family transport system permease protein